MILKYIRFYFAIIAINVIATIVFFVSAFVLTFQAASSQKTVAKFCWVFIATYFVIQAIVVFRLKEYTVIHKIIGLLTTLVFCVLAALLL